VPSWSWLVWSAVPLVAIAVLRSKKGGLMVAARQLAPIAPAVLLLTLPAVLFAAAEQGPAVGGALLARALATAAAGLATVSYLGPVDLIAGLRALKIPDRCLEIVHAMLVSLAAIVRQVEGMLRSRTARGAGHAPWSGLVRAPAATLRGFGRVTASLFLRSLERAEALERARRARGAGPW
jgi:energy-coupling factor transporter transmembrane protein EcfT